MQDDKSMALEIPCWDDVGVWGPDSPSCPKLAQATHCVNCEVFVEKGRALFEQEPSSAYLHDWAQLLAAPRAEASASLASMLVFRLEEEWLALPTAAFKCISDPAAIHSIPHKSDALLLGLANVGGSLQLCISLKSLLGIDADVAKAPANAASMCRPRFLMLERSGQTWVFAADEILGIRSYDPEKRQNTPSTVSRANPSFIRMVLDCEGRSVGLIDDELVLFALKRSLL